MAQYEIAPSAERDIDSVLHWTHLDFGERAMKRYNALLTQAIRDVAADPELAGSTRRPEIAASARTYHIIHSRSHVNVKTGRVRRPRHFLLYRTRTDGVVKIGRVLHEKMDLKMHLPDEYRPAADE